MKYGEIRDASLKLLNQYSLAGETIPETYNNQSDYIKRIPQLVDDAMWLIASGPRRLRTARVLDPDRSKDQNGMNRFMLPDDLMDIIPGGLFIVDHGEHHYDTSYARLDEKRILLPHYTHGTVWLEYYRRPESVQEGVPTGGTLPADDYELDNSYETHRCIPYYVAAHLVMTSMMSMAPVGKGVLRGGHLQRQPSRHQRRNSPMAARSVRRGSKPYSRYDQIAAALRRRRDPVQQRESREAHV